MQEAVGRTLTGAWIETLVQGSGAGSGAVAPSRVRGLRLLIRMEGISKVDYLPIRKGSFQIQKGAFINFKDI